MAKTIPVVVSARSNTESKALLGKGADAVVAQVDVERVRANLDALTKDLAVMFETLKAPESFSLKEVEVGLEITAEGGVNLIGTLTVGAKAAVTLKFERS